MRSIITISGLPGSGTSTAAKLLARKLKLKHIDAGSIFRKMAQERGLSLEIFTELARKNFEFDRILDKKILKIARGGKNVILEGRLTGWLAKKYKIPAYKIWLKASLETRAKRVARREKINFNGAEQAVRIREKSEAYRYRRIYHIDIKNLSVYDIVIATDKIWPNQIIKIILRELNQC